MTRGEIRDRERGDQVLKKEGILRFGLVDCEAFYVSCERIFRPDLWNRPVVVLSNNDGCIVSLSQEAKALGLKRGDPYFRVADTLKRQGVAVFSSNFPLYGDISRRVFSLLRRFPVEVEEYSIDEAFLHLPQPLPPHHLFELGLKIRSALLNGIGVPVRVGFAATRTLAKVASSFVKLQGIEEGVAVVTEKERKRIVGHLPLEEIWGIGTRSLKKLKEHGILTTQQFLHAPPSLIRSLLGVAGWRIHQELNGVPVLPASLLPLSRKGIISSHTFPQAIECQETLYGILLRHLQEAMKRLAEEKLYPRIAGIILRTSSYARKRYEAAPSMEVSGGDLKTLAQAIRSLLAQVYRPGYSYRKAGVYLFDLIPRNLAPRSLFAEGTQKRWEQLSQLMHRLRERYGEEALFLAPEILHRSALPLRRFRSPRYTTSFSELPSARCPGE